MSDQSPQSKEPGSPDPRLLQIHPAAWHGASPLGWPGAVPPVGPGDAALSENGSRLFVIGAIMVAVVAVASLLMLRHKASDDDLKDISHAQTVHLLDDELDVTIGTMTRDIPSALPITLKNRGNRQYTFTVHLDAMDIDGRRFTDDSERVPDLGPGESATLKAFGAGYENYTSELRSATFRVEVSRR